MKKIFTFLICLTAAVCCDKIDRYPDVGIKPDPEKPEQEKPEEEKPVAGTIIPFTTASLNDEGLSYVWDESVIPEITIHITEDEWNRLLMRYDEFSNNVDYFHADFTYRKGDEVIFIEDGGIRMRGNTSRRRPEGNGGEYHNSENPDWHHCHFGINFRKFHKDKEHTLKGIRKVNLKWFKDDPCYVRELYCYDLFRRYGIWTSAFSTYCRVWLDVEGDKEPAYFGVYNMIEPIDDKFVEKRVDGRFGSDEGNLWKCVYGEGGMADLRSTDDWKFNWDQDNGVNYTYEFKGDEEDFPAAKAQLQDFILKLNGKGEESFYKWIKEVCDVEFLLKTYAVNVVTGMWDDHWNNGNNFYLYFNSTDKYNYQVFLLPYDYDNTLGTSLNCGNISDAGRHDPYDWGNAGILMERLMRFEDFRQMYKDALMELTDPANALFHMDASVPRIQAWQNLIRPYVSNDTGEDMAIKDKPASWGNHHEYRLMDTGNDNFFRVKTETVSKMK
jgi:spore coat protein CotH